MPGLQLTAPWCGFTMSQYDQSDTSDNLQELVLVIPPIRD